MARKLDNYLRTYRRRAGFSQDEVAFLLGSKSGTKVSRYERFARRPTLKTALAYEVIFDVPSRELFLGIHEEAERATVRRARALAKTLRAADPGRTTERKLAALEAISSRP